MFALAGHAWAPGLVTARYGTATAAEGSVAAALVLLHVDLATGGLPETTIKPRAVVCVWGGCACDPNAL